MKILLCILLLLIFFKNNFAGEVVVQYGDDIVTDCEMTYVPFCYGDEETACITYFCSNGRWGRYYYKTPIPMLLKQSPADSIFFKIYKLKSTDLSQDITFTVNRLTENLSDSFEYFVGRYYAPLYDINNLDTSSTITNEFEGWIKFNITDLVNNWAFEEIDNFGLVIKMLNENCPTQESSAICQSLYPNIRKWPKIEAFAQFLPDTFITSPEIVASDIVSFSLIDPADDETLNFTKSSFIWHQARASLINSPSDLEYIIYLDKVDDFRNPRIISDIYDTTYTVESLTPGTTYFWKVLAKNIDGDSLWSSETNAFFVSHDATGIKPQISNNKSQTFELYANYPNPFNPETTINYNLPTNQSVYQVTVKIYDALGQLITTLVNEPQNPGMHTVKWDGKNTTGQKLPSGIYFYVVEAEQLKATQKMLLVR